MLHALDASRMRGVAAPKRVTLSQNSEDKKTNAPKPDSATARAYEWGHGACHISWRLLKPPGSHVGIGSVYR